MTFFVKRSCQKLVLRIKRSLSTGREPWYRGYFGCVSKELYSSFLLNRIYNTVTVVFVIRCKHSIILFPHRISCSHTTWGFNDVLLLITNKQTKINHLLSKYKFMQGPDIKYLCSQTAWQITTQSSKSPIKSDFKFKHMAKIKQNETFSRPFTLHLRKSKVVYQQISYIFVNLMPHYLVR